MEGNVCDVNHLDSDVILPPRKRLLACLKKQNSFVNGNSNPNPNSDSNSQSSCNSLNQLDARITFLLKPHLSNDNPSQEEIVIASRAAAEVAVKVAMAARAAAQEKAVIAGKAMAAAKKALDLVANIDGGQEISSFAEQYLIENKRKKQVDVQMLYENKNPRLENGKTNDEESARKLHQAINSSPRISNVKSHNHKKLKTSENGRISNDSIVGEKVSSFSHEKETEGTRKSKLENGSKAKCGDDDVTTFGRKRGRMKQKKLPLSICNYRDQATPKEDVACKNMLSVGPSGGERGPLWKCQAFKAPVCVK
ncbi:hypothetical protein E3N88_29860 [Mikania micrantha]|uniref:Uncharacterized protein n=1 Tax=Mikania micrantha TaxID=192012 RepID=A0A5N6MM53_9ASTR|nr:hypothetical protein E3N88_29860 [Mikania micrantha]